MFETGEDLAFARDALLDAAVDEPEVRQLESHAALDGSVDELGEPDRRGAALPEFAQQAIGSDDGSRPQH